MDALYKKLEKGCDDRIKKLTEEMDIVKKNELDRQKKSLDLKGKKIIDSATTKLLEQHQKETKVLEQGHIE